MPLCEAHDTLSANPCGWAEAVNEATAAASLAAVDPQEKQISIERRA